MSNSNFSELIRLSSESRPQHVPAGFARVDHWGKSFNKGLFTNYERLSETKRYRKAVSKKLCADLNKAQKPIIKPGQKHKGTGIWVHPLIAAHYASWLNAEFAVLVNETFLRVVEGDSDLAAEMMIRDHNRHRVERAKKRVLVSDTNKETMRLATMNGDRYADVHNDRYRGLYRKSASKLREEAGLKKKQTPLSALSEYDLNLNSLANQMAIKAKDSGKVFDAANGLRQLHQQTTGTELNPTWEENLLRPDQARAIAFSSDDQMELPI